MLAPTPQHVCMQNGRFDATSRRDVGRLFEALPQDPYRDRLVVYFHGGLVHKQLGLAAVDRLYPLYRRMGVNPIFFVWQSGLLEVIQHNLAEIYQERIYRRLVKWVAQYALGKLDQTPGARGVGLALPDDRDLQRELREPSAGEPFQQLDPGLPDDAVLYPHEEAAFRAALEQDPVLVEEVQAIVNSLSRADGMQAQSSRSPVGGSVRRTLMSPEVLDELRNESAVSGQRGLISSAWLARTTAVVLKNVLLRFVRKRDHGFYPTVVEEVLRQFYVAAAGKAIWDQMKQDAADAYGDDAESFAGTGFLEELAKYLETGAQPRFTLVGHSAGAIHICHFLKHAQQRLPPRAAFDVVLLAPACSCRLLADTLLRYANRISNLRIFGLTDTAEQTDQLVPLVYPRSLLYLVSGILEREPDTPIAGMQRFFSGRPPFDSGEELLTVREYLAAHAGSAVWAVERSGPGRNCDAARHTDFATDVPTVESLKHIITKGFRDD